MSNSNQRYFHLTLGPVQGFVAQARRTRDFWAGSFLLSWMAGVAMLAVEHQKGEVLFPKPDAAFLDAMCGETTKKRPQQGSLPNRFKALVGHDFDPERVVAELMGAWQALAEWVWKADIEPFLKRMKESQRQTTRDIWDRQVSRFWEVNWVMTDDASAEKLLERRKNWRSHWPAQEGGVICMMMADQQELSGQKSPNAEQLKTFWEPLRNKKMEADLRDGEVLSAIALIKRRFVRHFAGFRHHLNGQPDAPLLKGWKLPYSVPSVVHLAALPWLMKVLADAKDKPGLARALEAQLKCGEDALGSPEAASILPGLEKAFEQADLKPKLAGVDSSIFFSTMLENPRSFDGSEPAADQVAKLQEGLRTLKKAADLGEPSPFYAILMMDGDNLGSQLSDQCKQQPISLALNAFTTGVPERVEKHGGFLVYAGGDDVLALLPVTSALSCAAELRHFYASCFPKQEQEQEEQQPSYPTPASKITTSLSGAVLYCHVKRTLTGVLQDAHHLLDKVAKDKTGRDAIAVRVWQPGGVHLTWSQPWQIALRNQGAGDDLIIEDIAQRLRDQDDQDDARFTHGFLFRIKALGERLPLLMEDEAQRGLLTSLVRAELLHSGLELHNIDDVGLDELVDQLLRQAVPFIRRLDTTGWVTLPKSTELNTDTFKLVRFLAREGRIER